MTKYQDPETLQIVSSAKKIASRYLKTWFIIDFISIIPYELFFSNTNLIKLIRLIRLPKLWQMIDMKKFDKIIEALFTNSKNDKLMLLYNVRFTYKILRLVLMSIALTYFVGCFWYMYCDNLYHKLRDEGSTMSNFIEHYGLEERNAFEKLLISCYFALTTLTTVGYGDYSPKNNHERVICIFIMFLGVALFSYVMGSFNDLIVSHNHKIGLVDKGADLQNWLELLSKYSKHKTFNRQLLSKIDHHFTYFWKNDRNSGLSQNDPYLKNLPKPLKMKLIEFLWGDVFHKFSYFLLFFDENKQKYFNFYYKLSFLFMPRYFLPEDLIYSPDNEVEELYLLTQGSLVIGYSLHDNGQSINYCKKIKAEECIGDFYVLYNQRTKYYYKAFKEIKCFGVDKEKFNEILFEQQGLYLKMRTKAYRKYHDRIKIYMEKKFDEEVEDFNNSHRNIQIAKMDEVKIGMTSNCNLNSVDSIMAEDINLVNMEIYKVIEKIDKEMICLDDDLTDFSKYLGNLTKS